MDDDVRHRPPYIVHLSYLIGFARVCSHVTDFNGTNLAFKVPPSVTQYVVSVKSSSLLLHSFNNKLCELIVKLDGSLTS